MIIKLKMSGMMSRLAVAAADKLLSVCREVKTGEHLKGQEDVLEEEGKESLQCSQEEEIKVVSGPSALSVKCGDELQ